MALFLIPCDAAVQSDVDIVGDTRIISSARKVTGDATGSAVQSARAGKDFHIVIVGLPADQTVQLELGFAELEGKAPGERTFNLSVNEKPALSDFDIVKEAGGPLRSVVKRFTITPSRGFLDFHFKGINGDAAVNYIQITGEGVKKLISMPAPETVAFMSEDDEYHIPPDQQAAFDVESGTIHLDQSSETWNSGLPLGGIGTGKFEILPNGQFANFTINNSWDLPVLRPQGTFLAIATKASSDGGMARLLQVNPTDLSENDYFKDYQTVEETTFTGQFPFGVWEMKDDDLPLKVKVEAWSPLLPYNVSDSTLPGAVVSVTLRNVKNYPVSTAVAFSWEDLNGRGGSLLPNDQHGFIGQSTHKDAATSNVTGFQISSNHAAMDRASTFMGDYFVGTPIKGASVTRNLNWNPRTGSIPWWKKFKSQLRLNRIPASPASEVADEKSGPTASTICVSFNLAPQEVRRVPFIVSWYFPRIVTLDSAADNPSVETPDYADRFGSSVGVASYIASNRRNFRENTAEWFDMVQRATVPQWMKSHVLNSLFPMRSNTIFLKNDRFAMLEAPADMKGMLGPVDLRMAAGNFLRLMYPDLERTELNLYARAQDDSGRIPRYVGNIHGALAGFDPQLLGADWIDPTASWLLQIAAYWRETADDSFILSLKPAIIKARDFLKKELQDGNVQSALNAFSATEEYTGAGKMSELKVLAALRAAQELLQEPPDEIDQVITARLGAINAVETTTTFAALMAGEYALQQAGLRGLMNFSTITDFLRLVYRNNFQHTKPVPLMEADSAGSVPPDTFSFPIPLQSYVGALGLSSGLPDIGIEPYLRVFQIAYAAQKAPWKQALRYNVPAATKASIRYHRTAMAAWSVWRGLSGVVYDRPNQRLYLNPQTLPGTDGDMEMPVFTPAFWGWLKYNESASTGTLSITRINTETTQTLLSVASGLNSDGTLDNLITFDEPFTLEKGATLQLNNWPNTPHGSIVPMKPILPEPLDEISSGTLSAADESTTSAANAEGEIIEADEIITDEAETDNDDDTED